MALWASRNTAKPQQRSDPVRARRCPRRDRLLAWQRLSVDLDVSKLDQITNEIGLAKAILVASQLLDGKLRRRAVVDVNR